MALETRARSTCRRRVRACRFVMRVRVAESSPAVEKVFVFSFVGFLLISAKHMRRSVPGAARRKKLALPCLAARASGTGDGCV